MCRITNDYLPENCTTWRYYVGALHLSTNMTPLMTPLQKIHSSNRNNRMISECWGYR